MTLSRAGLLPRAIAATSHDPPGEVGRRRSLSPVPLGRRRGRAAGVLAGGWQPPAGRLSRASFAVGRPDRVERRPPRRMASTRLPVGRASGRVRHAVVDRSSNAPRRARAGTAPPPARLTEPDRDGHLASPGSAVAAAAHRPGRAAQFCPGVHASDEGRLCRDPAVGRRNVHADRSAQHGVLRLFPGILLGVDERCRPRGMCRGRRAGTFAYRCTVPWHDEL